MTEEIRAHLTRLSRRVVTLLSAGRVKFSNDSDVVQRVQVQTNDLETIDNIPRLVEFGFTSVLPDGSDVTVAFLTGDRSNGVVVASNHQPSRPTGLEPGESMMYSLDGKRIYLKQGGGIIVDAAGQDVTVQNAADVTWTLTGKLKVTAPGGVEFDTPNVDVSGDVTDNTGTGNSESMKSMRVIFDEHDHDIAEVQSGGSTLTTKVPNQQA